MGSSSFSKAQEFFRFLAVAVLSLGLMITDYNSSLLEQFRAGIYYLVNPLERIAQVPRHLNAWFESTLQRDEDIRLENEQLKLTLAQLRSQLFLAQRFEEENNRLRNLLETNPSIEHWQVIPARILASPGYGMETWFTLDKGSNDGIDLNLPVVLGGALIGRITQVTGHASRVTLITDAHQQIPVYNKRSGVSAVLQGRNLGMMRLAFVDANADVKVGDELLTLGTGKIFPSDLMVARVHSVQSHDGQAFLDIEAKPERTLQSESYVIILKRQGGKP